MLGVIVYWHLHCPVKLIEYCDARLTAAIGYLLLYQFLALDKRDG